MANIEFLQCPNCGNRLEPRAAGKIIQCDFCGSTLHVKEGAAGIPMAEMAQIESHTELLALQQARKRLKEKLLSLESNVEELNRQKKTAEPTGQIRLFGAILGMLGWAWTVIGIGFLRPGSSDLVLLISFVFVAIPTTVIVLSVERRAKRKVQQRIQDKIDAKSTELERLRSRLEEVESRLDELCEEI